MKKKMLTCLLALSILASMLTGVTFAFAVSAETGTSLETPDAKANDALTDTYMYTNVDDWAMQSATSWAVDYNGSNSHPYIMVNPNTVEITDSSDTAHGKVFKNKISKNQGFYVYLQPEKSTEAIEVKSGFWKVSYQVLTPADSTQKSMQFWFRSPGFVDKATIGGVNNQIAKLSTLGEKLMADFRFADFWSVTWDGHAFMQTNTAIVPGQWSTITAYVPVYSNYGFTNGYYCEIQTNTALPIGTEFDNFEAQWVCNFDDAISGLNITQCNTDPKYDESGNLKVNDMHTWENTDAAKQNRSQLLARLNEIVAAKNPSVNDIINNTGKEASVLVDGAAQETLALGSTVSLKAVAGIQTDFAGWYLAGNLYSADAEISEFYVTENNINNLEARFVLNEDKNVIPEEVANGEAVKASDATGSWGQWGQLGIGPNKTSIKEETVDGVTNKYVAYDVSAVTAGWATPEYPIYDLLKKAYFETGIIDDDTIDSITINVSLKCRWLVADGVESPSSPSLQIQLRQFSQGSANSLRGTYPNSSWEAVANGEWKTIQAYYVLTREEALYLRNYEGKTIKEFLLDQGVTEEELTSDNADLVTTACLNKYGFYGANNTDSIASWLSSKIDPRMYISFSGMPMAQASEIDLDDLNVTFTAYAGANATYVDGTNTWYSPVEGVKTTVNDNVASQTFTIANVSNYDRYVVYSMRVTNSAGVFDVLSNTEIFLPANTKANITVKAPLNGTNDGNYKGHIQSVRDSAGTAISVADAQNEIVMLGENLSFGYKTDANWKSRFISAQAANAGHRNSKSAYRYEDAKKINNEVTLNMLNISIDGTSDSIKHSVSDGTVWSTASSTTYIARPAGTKISVYPQVGDDYQVTAIRYTGIKGTPLATGAAVTVIMYGSETNLTVEVSKKDDIPVRAVLKYQLFEDDEAKVYDVISIADADSIVANALSMPGREIEKWLVSGKEVAADQVAEEVKKATSDVSVVAVYKIKENEKFNITAADGSAEFKVNGTAIDANGYNKMDIVTLYCADANFSYWEINGNVVSYNKSYACYITEDMTVKAVFGTAVTNDAAITAKGFYDNGRLIMIVERSSSSSNACIEHGIIFDETGAFASADKLVLENASNANGVRVVAKTTNVKANGTYVLNKGLKAVDGSTYASGSTITFRGYMKLSNGTMIYSDIASITVQ